jgi:hypothetical protein
MDLGETGRMVVALVETGAFCIIALGSLCEINNWWERRAIRLNLRIALLVVQRLSRDPQTASRLCAL